MIDFIVMYRTRTGIKFKDHDRASISLGIRLRTRVRTGDSYRLQARD